jgi:hypothetical protein
MQSLETGLDLAVIALAAALTSYPELRASPVRLVFLILWAIAAAALFRRFYRAGVLTRTPGEIYRMKERPKTSLLDFLAVTGGALVGVFVM